MLLHAAELHEGAPPRFDGIELLVAHEPLRLHLDMEPDLLIDPRLGGASVEKAQTGARGVKQRHGMIRKWERLGAASRRADEPC